jgi:hypothetical protein
MRPGGIYNSGEIPGALPGSASIKLQPGGDTACPAGTNTQVAIATVGQVAASGIDANVAEQGFYVAEFKGAIWIAFGASVPTALQFTASWTIPGIGTGNDTHIVEPSWLTSALANSTVVIPMVFSVSTGASTFVPGFGTCTVALSCQPTGAAVTVKRSALATGTQVLVQIVRRDD